MTTKRWRRGRVTRGLAAQRARESTHAAEPFDWRDLIGSPDLIYPDSARAAVVSIDEAVARCGRSVVLFARVSSQKQKRTVPAQQMDLESAALRAGLQVIGRVTEVENAGRPRRPMLKKAIDLARQRGAFVLAHNPSRYLRHPDFGPSINFDLLPTGDVWVVLAGIANDVALATVLDPCATNREMRSAESVRGQNASNHHGGRPRKWRKGARGSIREKRDLLASFDGSNVKAFCSRHGISTKSFYEWRREFGDQ